MAIFPEISVTVQVTVVLPTGKEAGASLLTISTIQLSEVVGAINVSEAASQTPRSAVTVVSLAQIIIGSISSITTISCVQLSILPLVSITVHVTVVVPIGNMAGASLVTEVTLQLSSKAGSSKNRVVTSQLPLALNVSLAAQVMLGGSESETVTVWVQTLTFPDVSATVHSTIVIPRKKLSGALFVIISVSQLSFADIALRSTPTATQPSAASTLIAGGQITEGTTLSTTVTNCSHVVLFPESSVMVHVTVVVPNGNTAGASLVGRLVEQLSETTGAFRTNPVTSQEDPELTVVSEAHVIVGLILSIIVIIAVQLSVLPKSSVTVIVTILGPRLLQSKSVLDNEKSRLLSQLSEDPSSTASSSKETIPVLNKNAEIFIQLASGPSSTGVPKV